MWINKSNVVKLDFTTQYVYNNINIHIIPNDTEN